MQYRIKYGDNEVSLGDTIYSYDYFKGLCESNSLTEIARITGISEWKCKNICSYFNLTPQHSLRGNKRCISIVGDTLTYWDDDNKISTMTKSEYLKYYHEDNHTDDETEEHFRIHPSIVRRLLDLPMKPRKLTLVHNRETCKKKYGDEHYNNMDKHRRTCLDRYGVDNIFKDTDFIKEKFTEKFGVSHPMHVKEIADRVRDTCLEKYGAPIPILTKEVQEKAKKTCREHYGVDFPMQSSVVKGKYDFKDISRKAFETKKKNGTLNTSKPEQTLKKALIDKYGEDNVDCQYSDERYPFKCDFHIKGDDIFIELNLFFTHGGHPFDKHNEKDVELLTKWKEKAEHSTFYKNAITVWTIRDADKIKTAKKNNLKYKTIYTMEEYNMYIEELEASEHD